MMAMKKIVLVFAIVILAVFSSCAKEESPKPTESSPNTISLVGSVWEGRMVNPTFEDTYWDETMTFVTDSTVLVFRRAFFEGELTGARTINTIYYFDGKSSGTIFKDETIPFSYDTIDGEITLTILDYYPHVFHKLY